MDTGHYHPTENVADKLSAVVPLIDDVLLHISRGLRWDSDHVLIQGDDLSALMQEMKRGGFFHREYLCLQEGVPVGTDWLTVLRRYEQDVQSKRR